MKVSVIIPVYNVKEYLEECIKSVQKQTLQDIEIICVDDGSDDGSLHILQELAKQDDRLVILTQQNRYAGAARNRGIEIAKGEYLIFLDSDDFFEPDLLEVMFQACEKNHAQISVCDADNYDVNTGKFFQTGYIHKAALPTGEVFSVKELGVNTFLFCYPMPWNKMFKRSLIEAYNLKFQAIRKTNDLGFVCLALACADSITTTDKILVHYRVGMKNSLQAKNKGMDMHFAEALEYLQEGLQERQKMEAVKESFDNLVVRTFLYEYKRLLKSDYRKMYEWFFKEGIKQFQIDSSHLITPNRVMVEAYMDKAVEEQNAKRYRRHFVLHKLYLKLLKKDTPYRRYR